MFTALFDCTASSITDRTYMWLWCLCGSVLSYIVILVPWNMLCPHFTPVDFTRQTNLIWFTHHHLHKNPCVNMISGACPAFSLTTSPSSQKHLQAKICPIEKLSICAWSHSFSVNYSCWAALEANLGQVKLPSKVASVFKNAAITCRLCTTPKM